MTGSGIRIDRLTVRLTGVPPDTAGRISVDLGRAIVERLGPVLATSGPIRASLRSLEVPKIAAPSGEAPTIRDAVAGAVADSIATRLPARVRAER